MAQGYEERLQKLFVGGLNRSTSDETVKEYFEKYGELTDCVVIRDPSKNSRGFGYVTFSDYHCTFAVLNEKKDKGHNIDGKDVEVKRAIPRDDSNPISHTKTKKIFIGGLKKDVEESEVQDEIEKVLEGSGTVVKIDLIRDKESQELRGFGFIDFEDEDTVDTLCCVKRINIKGKMVEVKKAEPKNKDGGGGGSGGRGSRGGGFVPRGGGRGGGYGRGGGGYNQGGGGGYDSTFGAAGMYGGGDMGNYGAAAYGGAYGAAAYGGGYGAATGAYDSYGGMGAMYGQSATNFGPQNTGFGGGRGGGRFRPY